MRPALLALALCAAPSLAFGQTGGDDALRRRLILQAGALRDHGDHQGALDRLREAAARRMSPSLRLFIAQEERALGQNLDALRDARACAAEFEHADAIAHRDEFLSTCQAMVEELAQGTGRLIVRLPSDAPPGTTVTVRGQALPREAFGTPWDLTPGTAWVQAEAPGRGRFSREVTITASMTSSLRVEFSAAPAPVEPDAPREAPDVFSQPSEPATPHPDVAPNARGSDAGRWALLGTSGALFLSAALFYAAAGGALDDRDALCQQPVGRCTVATPADAQEANDHQDRASSFNTLGNVTIGLGTAAAIGGLVWWVVALNARPAARRVPALVFATPTRDGAVVGLGGAF